MKMGRFLGDFGAGGGNPRDLRALTGGKAGFEAPPSRAGVGYRPATGDG